jgi:hypothetical protein
MPDRMSEYTSDKMTDRMPDRMSKNMSEFMSGRKSLGGDHSKKLDLPGIQNSYDT